jgi:hypothetical protein
MPAMHQRNLLIVIVAHMCQRLADSFDHPMRGLRGLQSVSSVEIPCDVRVTEVKYAETMHTNSG